MKKMKKILKYTFIGIGGLFAGCTLWLIASLVYMFLCGPAEGPTCFLGAESYAKSTPGHFGHLTPPKQSDPNFPMVVETSGKDYLGFVIFRASAAWQEAFKKAHPYPDELGDGAILAQARNLAEELEDKRVRDFISGKEWQSFHKGFLDADRTWHVNAHRDASGEYVLLYLYTL